MKNQNSSQSVDPGSFGNDQQNPTSNKCKQRLANTTRLGKLGWWEWDIHGAYIEASDELYELYCIDKATQLFSTKTYLSLVHPDDLSDVMKIVSNFWQVPHHQYEHRIVKPNGEIMYVSMNVETIRDDKNNMVQIHGTVKDISDDKKAENEAKEAQRRLENIVESIGDGFIAVDRNWTIIYWNKKAEQVTGKKREVVLGKNLLELYPKEISSKYFEKFRQAMADNQPVHFVEFSPEYNIWTEVSAYPSQDGLSIYSRDITKEKQLEDERKRIEERLQKTNENLAHTLQNMSDGFSTVDRNWTFTFLNDKLVTMLGGTHKNEFLGKNLWECFPEAVSLKFFTGYHKALAENTSVSIEEYYPPLDIWLEVNVYPDANGLSFFLRDITERKRNEKRVEFIAKATFGVIWEQKIETGQVVMDAEKCKELVGYEINDNSFHRSFWLENIHPEDLPAIKKNREFALQHNLDFYLNEYRFKKADGKWAWLKSRIYLVKDLNGKALSLVGTVEDVTSKRLSEKALVESEMSYRQLFNNNPLPTVIVDANSMYILDANSVAIEQYGYSRAELLSMTLLDFHPKDQHKRLLTQRNEIEAGVRNNLGTIYHEKKNGERIFVEISATPIHYKGQDAILATAKDVTEKERLQQEMVEQKINYQKSITKAVIDAQENERSEIGKELHDNVSQILATAKLYIGNIIQFPEMKDLFVNKSVNLLDESINEIRRLSHVLVTPTISDVGFKDTLLELIENYQGLQTFAANYAFDFDEAVIDKSLKLTIYRILQELFHNTMKHAKASAVQIEIKCIGNSLQITYEDNGIGYNPKAAKKGIGLTNITNRVNAYQGAVKLKSSIGNGYKMKIFFPIE